MRSFRQFAILATGLTIMHGVGSASAQTPFSQTSDERISALEKEVVELRAALRVQNQDWLTEQRAAEIKGLVEDVLADADVRASLLQSDPAVGYDRGFFIGSSDGNWLFRVNFLLQQRALWNHARDNALAGIDNDVYGFENTNSILTLSGHVVNPDWFYRLDINFGSPSDYGLDPARSSMNSPGHGFDSSMPHTLNAYLGHDFGNGWKVTAGTMKLPLLREELVEDQFQLAVERSNFNYFFTGGYSDGVMLSHQSERLRGMVMVSDGARLGQTPLFGGPGAVAAPAGHAEFAFTSRAEFLANGSWSQFNDFSSSAESGLGILIGGAVHWQKAEFGAGPFAPEPEQELLILTGDISLECGPFNLFAAVAWSDVNSLAIPIFPAGTNMKPWGFVVQGGFNIARNWELFARYELVDHDLPATIAALDDLSIVTIGFNRYFAGHHAKWTTDVGYSFGTLGFPSGVGPNAMPAGVTGVRPDALGADGQVVVRSQIQLLF